MKQCPRCHSFFIIKYGHIPDTHKQRFRCHRCLHQFSQHESLGYPISMHKKAVTLYTEGVGFRGIGRILGVSYVTAYYWIKAAAKALPGRMVVGARITKAELDELCSFIQKKRTKSGSGGLRTDTAKKSWTSSSATVVN